MRSSTWVYEEPACGRWRVTVEEISRGSGGELGAEAVVAGLCAELMMLDAPPEVRARVFEAWGRL